jgi:nitrite reductase (NADH) small subunit
VFRTSSDQVFALFDQCPHKKGPLSQGLVYDNRVACPLHNWVIDMNSGEATGPDEGCTRTFETKIDNGTVFISL